MKQRGSRKLEYELDKAISELKESGLNLDNYDQQEHEGLGDLVESVLSKFGITEERIKLLTGLQGCGCEKRKQWLNKVFSFNKKKKP